MITMLFHMTVKAGRDDEFAALAREMMRCTRAEDEGCLLYVIHRQADDPRQFVLHEQWRDQAAIVAHLERLFAATIARDEILLVLRGDAGRALRRARRSLTPGVARGRRRA